MNARQFLSQFTQPDPKYSPVPAWWWSGEKLEWPRMQWQMDQMRAMGIRNIVIINLAPSGTLFGAEPDDPKYQSDEWWQLFHKTCDYAKQIGVSIWFYDQIGFSGASFQADIVWAHPEYSAEQIKCVRAEGIGELRVECPGAGTPIAAYWFAANTPQDISYVELKNHAATIHAHEHSSLVLVYKTRQGFDFYNPAAAQTMLDTVHRQFEKRLPEHLGTTIVGSFQDELPELPTWGPTFGRTFEASFGYKLEEVIHRLFEEGDFESRRTRVDYHAHRAKLAEAAFFKPFFQWHEKFGLGCGYDQQSPAREARMLGCVGKYADYMQTQKWYAIPGSDLHGNGKLHSSIAFLHDRKRVWLEGFHSTGWGGSIADTFDWLLPYLQNGSNLYNPHAIYYGTKKGWFEWAPPSTCWRQPYAMHYKPFAEFISRLTKIVSQGILHASAAVLMPTTSVQSAYGATKPFDQAKKADQVFHETIGSMRWHQVMQGPIDKAALDFHILDEQAIQAANIVQGAIEIRGVQMRAIVLPATTMVHDSTLTKLLEFAAAGGKLIAVGFDTIESIRGKRIDLKLQPGVTILQNAVDLTKQIQDLPRKVNSPIPFLHRKVGEMNILLLPAVAGMATVVKWPHWFASQEHTTIIPERYEKQIEIKLPPQARELYRFDPVDGSIAIVGAQTESTTIDFQGAPFAVLCWDDTGILSNPVAKVSREATPIATLSDTWKCEYIPTLPDKYPDIYDANRPEQRLPQTVEFDYSSAPMPVAATPASPPVADADRTSHADATQASQLQNAQSTQKVLATFGPRAWTVGPTEPTPKPVAYSLEFGIQTDKMHINTIGPKGRVPEEFIDLGKLTKDQSATVRTGVVSDKPQKAILALAANAKKSVEINSQRQSASDDHYLAMFPVELVKGNNPINLTVQAERDGAVRLFWCLLKPGTQSQFIRPERMQFAGPRVVGAKLTFRKIFNSRLPIKEGKVKVSVGAIIATYVDDTLIGRQGGFDPYRPQTRGEIFRLPALTPGEHEIRIELVEPDAISPMFVDLLAQCEDGSQLSICSDKTWTVSRDGGEDKPVAIYSKQDADSTAWYLYHRPHPLPQSSWINGQANDVVLDLPLIAPVENSIQQVFEWTIPPGATRMEIKLAEASDITLWIDEKPTPIKASAVNIDSAPNAPARKARLEVRSLQLGGAVFLAPISYAFGPGTIKTGNWLDHGLRSYSGAMRMSQSLDFQKPSGKTTIDLGKVRGTVELFLNGQSAGVRFLSPYRFDVSKLIKLGKNDLELVVANTLGNFISTWSPTTWWSPDQLDCGVFGPVTISTVAE